MADTKPVLPTKLNRVLTSRTSPVVPICTICDRLVGSGPDEVYYRAADTEEPYCSMCVAQYGKGNENEPSNHGNQE